MSRSEVEARRWRFWAWLYIAFAVLNGVVAVVLASLGRVWVISVVVGVFMVLLAAWSFLISRRWERI